MSRLVVIAVLVLAAIAAADSVRSGAPERSTPEQLRSGADKEVIHPQTSSGFAPAGGAASTRVLHNGREYLSAEQIRAALPVRLRSGFFDVAHLAAAPDGSLVLAVFAFPASGPPGNAIEIWREGRLERSFPVRVGSFGGGIGFAAEGRLVAGLSGDGLLVSLFTREGRPVGHQSATSW